jgi:hypothetical protein
MKKFSVVLAAGLVLGIAGGAIAGQCPKLIKEGRDKVAARFDANAAQAKKLFDEAEALHKAAKHAESVATANKGLALVK